MHKESIVVTDMHGSDKPALMAVCECGNNTFVVFQLEGQDHPHLQCAMCDETYCEKGEGCESVEPEPS